MTYNQSPNIHMYLLNPPEFIEYDNKKVELDAFYHKMFFCNSEWALLGSQPLNELLSANREQPVPQQAFPYCYAVPDSWDCIKCWECQMAVRAPITKAN